MSISLANNMIREKSSQLQSEKSILKREAPAQEASKKKINDLQKKLLAILQIENSPICTNETLEYKKN